MEKNFSLPMESAIHIYRHNKSLDVGSRLAAKQSTVGLTEPIRRPPYLVSLVISNNQEHEQRACSLGI